MRSGVLPGVRASNADHVHYWLGNGQVRGANGSSPGRGLRRPPCGGRHRRESAILREDLEHLAATPATTAVRLLPGYDQWVLGPGTADAHVVPPARRTLVSRGANIVIAGGVVSGTWSVTGDQVVAAWFAEAGPPAREALAEEVARLAAILDRPLHSTVQTA